MTTKADFTPEEWDLVREGGPTAGMVVLTADKGGSFRETWALAKTYAEARKEHGESELLDALVAEKPDMKRYGSAEELDEVGLGASARRSSYWRRRPLQTRSPPTSGLSWTSLRMSPRLTRKRRLAGQRGRAAGDREGRGDPQPADVEHRQQRFTANFLSHVQGGRAVVRHRERARFRPATSFACA